MAGKPSGPSRGVKLRPIGKVFRAFETGVRKTMECMTPEERARLPSTEEFLKGMRRSTSVVRGLYNSQLTKKSIQEMARRMRIKPAVLQKLEAPTIELLWLQSQRPRTANPDSPRGKVERAIFSEAIESTVPAIVAEMEKVLGSGQRLTAYLNIIKEQAEPLGKGYLRWPTKK